MASALTPAQLASAGTEHAHQRAYFAALRSELPDIEPARLDLIYAIPNGGQRSASTAAKLKAEGVKAGTPDVCVPIPSCGYGALYIEFKKPNVGKLSADQIAKIERLLHVGNLCAVVEDWQAAITVTRAYLTHHGLESLHSRPFGVIWLVSSVCPPSLV